MMLWLMSTPLDKSPLPQQASSTWEQLRVMSLSASVFSLLHLSQALTYSFQTQQCRSHVLARRSRVPHPLIGCPHLAPLYLRCRIQEPSHSRVYPLSTCAADDSRKTSYFMAAGLHLTRPGETTKAQFLCNRNYFGTYEISSARDRTSGLEVLKAPLELKPAFWLSLMAIIAKSKNLTPSSPSSLGSITHIQ